MMDEDNGMGVVALMVGMVLGSLLVLIVGWSDYPPSPSRAWEAYVEARDMEIKRHKEALGEGE